MLSHSGSTLQISKCGSRSVPPNLVRHAPLVQIRFTKLAHWLDHWPKVSLLRQNPTCLRSYLAQTQRSASCRVSLIQNLTPSSVYSNRCCLGFRVACVFGFEYNVFDSIVIQQICKDTLHCQSHILIWVATQCGVVCFSESFLTLHRCGCTTKLPDVCSILSSTPVLVRWFVLLTIFCGSQM